MRNTLIPILLILFILQTSSGKALNYDKATTSTFLPIECNGKWGFINASGNIVITPQFDKIDENVIWEYYFKAGIKQSDEIFWGLWDWKGKCLVKPIYKDIQIQLSELMVITDSSFAKKR